MVLKVGAGGTAPRVGAGDTALEYCVEMDLRVRIQASPASACMHTAPTTVVA